ncbi:hypothetical protein RQM59_01465 [Flavobacteriaceae bacterium S356]|uniref:Uncharacterized protein n=1 Tax=Asprobacillus argus TaxID=3076534 RepID=A0ABU3LBB9_9FLAO|nr:hypothetical protein [Flavobacteriaceae bacterium S356]
MKKAPLICVLGLFLGNILYAQETQENKEKLPNSIYTFNYFSENPFDNFWTQKRVQFPSYDFVYVDFNDLNNNAFSIRLKNVWKKPSRFIYDDYAKYNRNYFLKDFFLKHDPTRWNMPPHRQ